MKDTPIKRHLIDETIEEFQITDFSKATIREVKAIAAKAETASGVEFIKWKWAYRVSPFYCRSKSRDRSIAKWNSQFVSRY